MPVFELEMVTMITASTDLVSVFLTEERLQLPVAPFGAYALLSSFYFCLSLLGMVRCRLNIP